LRKRKGGGAGATWEKVTSCHPGGMDAPG